MEATARHFSTTSQRHSKGYHIKYSNRVNYHPRRAVMYIPASDERKLKKSASLKIDTVVFDLEDGVAMNQKVRRKGGKEGAGKKGGREEGEQGGCCDGCL